jgi:hypothetical protein
MESLILSAEMWIACIIQRFKVATGETSTLTMAVTVLFVHMCIYTCVCICKSFIHILKNVCLCTHSYKYIYTFVLEAGCQCVARLP